MRLNLTFLITYFQNATSVPVSGEESFLIAEKQKQRWNVVALLERKSHWSVEGKSHWSENK